MSHLGHDVYPINQLYYRYIMKQPAVHYEIEVEGYLDERWSEWFGEMRLTHHEGNGGVTILTGEIPDQAALYGLLAKMRDLGLVLLSVKRLKTPP
jgi:hypothetical protein